jgi:hypothetical protein
MQHPPELKTKFLELRARGIPYSRIAEELSVSKPTLIQWGKSMAEEIADLQAAERELVREKLLGNFEQWLGRQVHHFNRLDEEFGRREFKYSPTESVFRMMMASRKLLDRYFFEEERPRQRRASEGRTPSSPATATAAILLPGAAETQSLGRSNVTELGKGEGQTGTAPRAASRDGGIGENENSKPPADRSRIEMQNQTFSGPFLDQKEGGVRASVETQNPAFYPPFIHQKQGGSTPDPLNQNRPEGRAVCPHSAGSQSEILNPKSEIESAFAPSSPCVESPAISARAEALSPDIASPEGPSAEAQNPAKTQPFTSQNPGDHNSNLSTMGHESRAMCVELAADDAAQADDPALQGESVPISPYESTREWLERQGITGSKIPKAAPIISA